MKTSLIALGTVLSLTAPAYAEGADPAEGSADSTILVVGQQDTPITVVPRGLSVSLGQEEFDAVNALNVEDLMKYAPKRLARGLLAGHRVESDRFTQRTVLGVRPHRPFRGHALAEALRHARRRNDHRKRQVSGRFSEEDNVRP